MIKVERIDWKLKVKIEAQKFLISWDHCVYKNSEWIPSYKPITLFMKRNSGTFALMSSSAGKAGVPYSGSYTGSKHALHGYFESLRTEKMATGIKVTMLCPGPTFSNLLAGAATEKPGEEFSFEISKSLKNACILQIFVHWKYFYTKYLYTAKIWYQITDYSQMQNYVLDKLIPLLYTH